MYRYETAGYINTANMVLAGIAASPRSSEVDALIQAAYHAMVTAAVAFNVPVEPQAWPADVKARGYKYNVDHIRYPDE